MIPLSKSLQKKSRDILKDVHPHMFIHDGIDDTKILSNIQKKFIPFHQFWKKFEKTRVNINSLINFIEFNNTAFIYFTSGSTGVSKGIKISHKNIISDVFAQVTHLHNFSLKKKTNN